MRIGLDIDNVLNDFDRKVLTEYKKFTNNKTLKYADIDWRSEEISTFLNNNMEEMLRNIKESKFISYECGKVFGNAYGNLRINTDKSSVEITNLQKTTPFF